MPGIELFTIGHSTHPIAAFLELLRRHEIGAVCDVRSQPYSRYNPQFNKELLAAALDEAGIAYAFLGRELGARVQDPSCWVAGRVSYAKVAQTDAFRNGLRRLHEGMDRYRVTLLCAEKDPITCHRMMLVTRNLRADVDAIGHIRADGSLETNEEAERRLLEAAGLPSATLFEQEAELIEQAYEAIGKRIAWSPTPGS